MIKSKPKIAGSASQHVKSNVLLALGALISIDISAKVRQPYRDHGRNALYTIYFLDRRIQVEGCLHPPQEVGR
jgi:hypothetical protein